MSDMQTLVNRICQERQKRGFVTDPVKIMVLLTEEVGEIAQLIKRTWSTNYETPDKEHIAEELADAFVILASLADQFDIDLETAVEKKFFKQDASRHL